MFTIAHTNNTINDAFNTIRNPFAIANNVLFIPDPPSSISVNLILCRNRNRATQNADNYTHNKHTAVLIAKETIEYQHEFV
jgi:hypothetical protein